MNSAPPPGENERPETVGAQIAEQLKHRLIDHLPIEPPGLRVRPGNDPVVHGPPELLRGHTRVRGHDDPGKGSLPETARVTKSTIVVCFTVPSFQDGGVSPAGRSDVP
jgi:hypothetical protein